MLLDENAADPGPRHPATIPGYVLGNFDVSTHRMQVDAQEIDVQEGLVERAEEGRSNTLLNLAIAHRFEEDGIVWQENDGPEVDRRSHIEFANGQWLWRDASGRIHDVAAALSGLDCQRRRRFMPDAFAAAALVLLLGNFFDVFEQGREADYVAERPTVADPRCGNAAHHGIVEKLTIFMSFRVRERHQSFHRHLVAVAIFRQLVELGLQLLIIRGVVGFFPDTILPAVGLAALGVRSRAECLVHPRGSYPFLHRSLTLF